jgi:sugar phosphate isomerase/epimerase
MRLRHPDGSTVHLSYCTNVHPAEDVDEVIAQLGHFAGPVRRAVGADRLGVGLWIPAAAATTFARDAAALGRLKAELAAQRLEVVTLNGFPYGGFHAPVVKRAVYRPDWTEPERLAYTVELAGLLAELLPEDVTAGSISTLPLGWRDGWSGQATAEARKALEQLAGRLARLADETGRRIRVGLEPEPGCIVQTTSQAVEVLREVDPAWVGLCLDACHLAVQFEAAGDAVALAAEAGVPVVKAQVSSALRPPPPRTPAASERLADFVEPRFLHQTRERDASGRVTGVDDLEDAIAGGLPGEAEWRVHFHVPVHRPDPDTTQPELLDTLAALVQGPSPVTTHLDVETYTWTVLPPDQRPRDDAGLVAGLAEELTWTRDRLRALGLEDLPA